MKCVVLGCDRKGLISECYGFCARDWQSLGQSWRLRLASAEPDRFEEVRSGAIQAIVTATFGKPVGGGCNAAVLSYPLVSGHHVWVPKKSRK